MAFPNPLTSGSHSSTPNRGNIVDGAIDFSDLIFVDSIDEYLVLRKDDLLYNRTNSIGNDRKGWSISDSLCIRKSLFCIISCKVAR